MITPVGEDSEMTTTVKAGISKYAVTDFFTQNDQLETMSLVLDEFFTSMDIGISVN